jgi:hypothetical protein
MSYLNIGSSMPESQMKIRPLGDFLQTFVPKGLTESLPSMTLSAGATGHVFRRLDGVKSRTTEAQP